MTPHALMIFAAGRGSRMGALTETVPKPLIEVAGKALIDHALDLALPGLRRVVNTHYRSEMLKRHLAKHAVLFSDEAMLLETGGGLRQALPLLGPDPVFTLNSDAVWRGPNPMKALAARWEPARMEALLLLVPPDKARGHSGAGDFLCDPAGRLRRGPGLVYTGAQIIRTERLHEIETAVFSLNLLWDAMLARGGLYGLTYAGQWCDVGRPASIPLAEAMLRESDVQGQ